MLRRALAIVLIALFAGAVLATPAGAGWFDAQLRTWDWQGPVQDRHPLRLAPEEAYDRYYLSIEAVDRHAVAYFNVEHDATGESICSGDLLVLNGNPGYHQCDRMRVGHTYTVTIHMVGGAKTHLWGVDV